MPAEANRGDGIAVLELTPSEVKNLAAIAYVYGLDRYQFAEVNATMEKVREVFENSHDFRVEILYPVTDLV